MLKHYYCAITTKASIDLGPSRQAEARSRNWLPLCFSWTS